MEKSDAESQSTESGARSLRTDFNSRRPSTNQYLFLLDTGAVMIRYGKGGKTRMVFIGRTTRRAMRAYLRMRHDSSPALFFSKDEERLTYDGLRLFLERRAKRAKLSNKPKLHGFRRAFAQHAAQRCRYLCFAKTDGTF